MSETFKIHLIGMACGALVFLLFWLATKPDENQSRIEPLVPVYYRLIEKDSPLEVARLSATKALNDDIVAKWAFSMASVCAFQQQIRFDPEGIDFAVYQAGSGTEGFYVPLAVNTASSPTGKQLSETCSDVTLVLDSSFLISDSVEVWRALREKGIAPSDYALAVNPKRDARDSTKKFEW